MAYPAGPFLPRLSSSHSFPIPPPPPPSLAPWSASLARVPSLEEEEDEDFHIDTSHMTPEEKAEYKAQRKLRKMNREKQKRLRLNDQFDHLCFILQMGKATRVEKLAVLTQTIRILCQLKAENALLKDQCSQMKDLLNQRQNGTSCDESTASPLPPKPASPLYEPEPQAIRILHNPHTGMVSHEMWAKDAGFAKQDIWSPPCGSNNHELLLKHQQQGSMLESSWNQLPSRQNDLDFAFGEENLVWLANPTANQQQLGGGIGGVGGERVHSIPFEHFAECDYKRCLLPKPEADSVEMFLTSSDDLNLLLQ